MIERSTVFVLGAGAHCSYGFPNGKSLKKEAVSAVRISLDPDSAYNMHRLSAILRDRPEEFQRERVEAFATALENSGQASIDAFLNANRHQLGFETIGKAAIAQVLLQRERKIQELGDDWLSYLFEVMIDGIDSPTEFIEKNKVSFVTFNYDTFLEHWLEKKIQHSFGIDTESASELLKRIPIHHVYGSLLSTDTTLQPCEDAWIRASRGIRTIFDTERYNDEIAKSKQLLSSADVVCLLGYGFHRENSQLLALTESVNRSNCLLLSSRFDIQDQEWARMTIPFSAASIHIQFAHYSHKCLHALRTLPIF